MNMKFICPKCNQPLTVTDSGTAVCPSRHSYDRSREGYYNLLLSSTGGTHGDNREMLEARRRFLDTGAYLPLANAVSALVAEHVTDGGTVLDIGCGEGYYTDIVAARCLEAGKRVDVCGFDISKDAVRLAAKKNKALSLAVASAYKIPIADASVDVAMNVFSPLALEETVRILRHGGAFVMAIPDTNHLFGLKSAIYKTPYKNEVRPSELDGLALVSTERIAYRLDLNTSEEISDLFMMTPYAYRTSREDRDRVLSLEKMSTEVEFIVFLYKKI